MIFLKHAYASFTKKEIRLFLFFGALLIIAGIAKIGIAIGENSTLIPVEGGVYREGMIGQPIAINPIISGNPTDQDISALIYPKVSDIIDTYTIEDNARVFLLNIKEGILWDDAKPISSDDIVFTIQSAQELGDQSPFSKTLRGVVVERMSELQTRLSVPTPYSFFDEMIKKLPIIPKHIFGSIPPQNMRLSSYNLEPVGAGPYKFKSFSQRKDGFITHYELTKNELFYNQHPFIQKFIFQFYENEENILKAFRLREISGFGSGNTTETKTISTPQTKITNIPMSRYYALFFNLNTNETLKNDSVRKALALALNKGAITSFVFPDGEATPIQGPLLSPSSHTQDKETASALLKKAKITGIRLTLTIPNIEFLKKTAEEIKKQWMEIEEVDDVVIRIIDSKDFVSRIIKSNEYDIILFGNVLENKKDLFPFWHSSQRMYPGLNLSFYKNSRVDLLIETIRQAKDSTQQNVLLESVENEILKDNPAIFLYTIPYTYIHTTELGGFIYDEKNDIQITNSKDRFWDIEKWYVTKARVLE